MSTPKYRKALWMGRGVIRRLERPLRRVAKRSSMILKARDELVERYHKVLLKSAGVRNRLPGSNPPAQASGVNPENMIWIFCTSKSGSTWLRSIMAELGKHKVWEEPSVGRLFGQFHDRALEVDLRRPDFVMADAAREGWIRGIRHFVLDCVGYARPSLGADGYLVVKEPNGSMGAPQSAEPWAIASVHGGTGPNADL